MKRIVKEKKERQEKKENQEQRETQAAYERFYETVSRPVRRSPMGVRLFRMCYFGIPYLTAAVYGVLLLLYAVGCADGRADFSGLARLIFVPLTGFLAVTLVRKGINAPRPYTKYPIHPLIHKEKEKESFPSRHTFSITIIAMSCLYCNKMLGAVMLFLAVLLGFTRVLAGVHFVKDIVWAYGIAVVWGILGFWVF